MKEGPSIAAIAALIGDPARANMLTGLMHGRALTATELAHEAGVTLSTASGHLAKLHAAGLVTLRKQGRHRYFRLSESDVAGVLEGLMGLASRTGYLRTRPGPKDPMLRQARVCYDHLAGDAGVRMFYHLRTKGFVSGHDDALHVTEPGKRFFVGLGIDTDRLGAGRRPLCRACLDWSERKSHLGGALGSAILHRIFQLQWARRLAKSRVVEFTKGGKLKFNARLAGAPHRR
jgi:DNA-binding transcriptional ArsR family regulator